MRWTALSLFLSTSSCSDPDAPLALAQGVVGELRQGTFLYRDCASYTSSCRSTVEAFPDCIALDSRFSLRYVTADNDELVPNSLSQDFFRTTGTSGFEARRVGTAAFLVTRHEQVVDILHLSIVPVDDAQLLRLDEDDGLPVILRPGDAAFFRMDPHNDGCRTLGGLVPVRATSNDSSIASVNSGSTVQITGVSPGTTTIQVSIGEFTQTIEVIVETPPLRPEPEPSGSGTEGGIETEGSESGTDETTSGTSESTGGLQ